MTTDTRVAIWSYYNLPKANEMIRSRAASEDLIWRGSYIEALVGYFRALPLPECRKPNPEATHA